MTKIIKSKRANGGRKTLKIYGKEHFRKLILKRWHPKTYKKILAAELANKPTKAALRKRGKL